jgi:indole-3-glycerol phosphate synthase
MTSHPTPDLLDTIVAATRKTVESRRAREPQSGVEARAARRRPRGDLFKTRLVRSGQVNIIAECKRRSPSRGILRSDYDPVAIAKGYERANAAALSVLTEPSFFDGALAHLEAVRSAVECPLLRKDFIVDEYQVYEAAASGADAALLIVAALSDDELRRLKQTAEQLGLAVLVEVHDAAELERALAAGATLVGVNNRNLRTMEVDTRASEVIAAALPRGIVAVSESGLRTAADIARLQAIGYNAFLVGERFMTAPDPGAALAELLQ